MKSGGLISEIVYHVDDDSVSNIRSDIWEWPLTIDAHHRPFELAIRIRRYPLDCEIIGSCNSSRRNHQREERAKSSAAERRQQHPALLAVFEQIFCKFLSPEFHSEGLSLRFDSQSFFAARGVGGCLGVGPGLL